MTPLLPTQPASLPVLLRALASVVAGIVALVAPAEVLKIIVFAGGGLLVIDGILSLLSVVRQSHRDGLYWVTVVRAALAIVAGLVIILAPTLSDALPLDVILTAVGVQAIIVGLLEVVIGFLTHRRTGRSSAIAGSGIVYVGLGLLLLFVPFSSAVLLIQIGGVLLLANGAIRLVLFWESLRQVTAQPAETPVP